MSSIEFAGIDWIGRGWLLLLAFTAATLVVVALRKSCRRLFGTERAFQLWLLPPLAMLASQLPHAAVASHAALPALVYMITSAAGGLPSYGDGSIGMDWRVGAVLVWCAGSMVVLLLAAFAQWRYGRRLLGAMPLTEIPSRWPIWRATSADVGPALVGAWRSRIVLPADFEHRYDVTERSLILAHEAMHARRRDGCWCLLAQLVVATFWFHPLAWWALSALRHDQELACDAAVLRVHGEHRRSYANAMLKTQASLFALPVGCPWSPRHPLTERIAMLKMSAPNRRRKFAGMLSLSTGMVALAGLVYAGTPDPRIASPSDKAQAGSGGYQLAVVVSRSGKTLAAPIVCMGNGQPASIQTNDKNGSLAWRFVFAVKPTSSGQVQVGVKGTVGDTPVNATLRGPLAESMRVKVGDASGKEAPLQMDVTPTAGCAAQASLSEHLKDVSARAAAESLAIQGGFVLVNPQVLHGRTTFNFQDMPADAALQLIARLDDMNAAFDGKRVQFVPK